MTIFGFTLFEGKKRKPKPKPKKKPPWPDDVKVSPNGTLYITHEDMMLRNVRRYLKKRRERREKAQDYEARRKERGL